MSFPVPSEQQIQQELGLPGGLQHISTGGFKAVYRMQNAAGEFEALKAIYIPDAGSDDDIVRRDQLVARATREIEALGQCDSPFLVKLGTVAATMQNIAGHDYLVYSEEFLQGDPLNTWISKKPLPSYNDLYSLLSILISLIRTLTNVGYLHRDIKPDNIIDTGLQYRRFVMLDLGIAYKMHGTDLTQGGGAPGTLRYMAPELLRPDYKNNMDFRCDLYAAGLTIYVLASGKHPFAPQPEHPYATVYRIMNIRPIPLATYRPDIPAEFCSIIDRCIRKKPALRFSQLDLVEDEIRKVKP